MLDDLDGEQAEIPVSNVDGPTTTALLRFCERVAHTHAQPLNDMQIRDLSFDDDVGMDLPKLQRLIKAGNFLGIEALVDSACKVAACAIENTQLMLPQLTMMKELLLGSAASADGRPSRFEVFALLSDVHSYQPELALKIIAAAEQSAPRAPRVAAQTAVSDFDGTSAEAELEDAQRVLGAIQGDLVAVPAKDRFWTMWGAAVRLPRQSLLTRPSGSRARSRPPRLKWPTRAPRSRRREPQHRRG